MSIGPDRSGLGPGSAWAAALPGQVGALHCGRAKVKRHAAGDECSHVSFTPHFVSRCDPFLGLSANHNAPIEENLWLSELTSDPPSRRHILEPGRMSTVPGLRLVVRPCQHPRSVGGSQRTPPLPPIRTPVHPVGTHHTWERRRGGGVLRRGLDRHSPSKRRRAPFHLRCSSRLLTAIAAALVLHPPPATPARRACTRNGSRSGGWRQDVGTAGSLRGCRYTSKRHRRPVSARDDLGGRLLCGTSLPVGRAAPHAAWDGKETGPGVGETWVGGPTPLVGPRRAVLAGAHFGGGAVLLCCLRESCGAGASGQVGSF